jgi:hypothetical protein
MEEAFEQVPYEINEVVEHFTVDHLTEEDKQLIQQLKLPGTESLFDPDPAKARDAAHKFLANFLRAGADRRQGPSPH